MAEDAEYTGGEQRECPKCGHGSLWDWKGRKNCGICGWIEAEDER